MRSSWPPDIAVLDLLPPALDAIAEAAWIAGVYLLVEIAWGRDVLLLAIPQLAVVVAAGIGLGLVLRTRASRSRSEGPEAQDGRRAKADYRGVAIATGAVLVVAAAGWLGAPDVRDAIGSLDPARALNLHPGGWLAGLALLRGLSHRHATDEDPEAAGAMRLGLPALVVVWLLGRSIGGLDGALFEDQAFVDTLVFMTAGLLGLGVAGIRALARPSNGRLEASVPGGSGAEPTAPSSDVDWRRNRQWLLVLVTVVAGMIVVALPGIEVAGRGLVDAVLAVLWVAAELVVLVVVVRAIPRAVSIAVPFLLAGFVIALALRLIGFRPEALASVLDQVRQALAFRPAQGTESGPGDAVTWFGFTLVLAAIVIVTLLVAAWLRRRVAPAGGDLFEERSVVVEPTAFRLEWPSLRSAARRTEQPIDAVAIYRALLRRLAADPELRRAPGETPADHARRLGEWTPGARSVARLALDYELARFGGRSLGAPEERRALERWRRLEGLLRRRPKAVRPADEDELEARARRRQGRPTLDEEQRPFGT